MVLKQGCPYMETQRISTQIISAKNSIGYCFCVDFDCSNNAPDFLTKLSLKLNRVLFEIQVVVSDVVSLSASGRTEK